MPSSDETKARRDALRAASTTDVLRTAADAILRASDAAESADAAALLQTLHAQLEALGAAAGGDAQRAASAAAAALPAYAARTLPDERQRREHVAGCRDAAAYYAVGMARGGAEKAWVDALGALLAADAPRLISGGPIASRAPNCAAESASEAAVLEGNRWFVRGAKSAVEVQTASLGQAVVLQDCKGATVRVATKAAAVLADGCSRTTIELSAAVVSNVELVACRDVRLVLHAAAPSVVLDGCEGVTLVVAAADAAALCVTTSKCADVRVCGTRGVLFPGAPGDADEDVELPLPFQFRTTIDAARGALVTVPVEHIGA